MKQGFAVFGGINMDILGLARKTLIMRDSNAGKTVLRPGGVGRNIAEHLRLLGQEVELVTALGTGEFADLLQSDCNKKQIGLTYAVRVPVPCSTYLAIHDEEGDMVLALNDMEALNLLPEDALRNALTSLSASCQAGVVDANLPPRLMQVLAEHAAFPLVADPVSVEKCHKLLPILPRLAAIKPNIYEARALTGRQEAADCAAVLLERGVKRVFISLGKDGLFWADAQGSGCLPAPKIPPVDLTGAGDSLCAALTLALSRGLSTLDSAIFAQNHTKDYLTGKQAAANQE